MSHQPGPVAHTGAPSPTHAHMRWVPFLIVYGFFAVVAQAVFVRETLVVFFGNELSLGITLGAWLVGVFLGAAMGGRLPRRAARVALHIGLVALVCAAPLGWVVLRQVRVVLSTPPGGYLSFAEVALGSLALVTPTGLLVGLLFPLIARELSAARPDAAGIGRLYVLEAVGSMLGGAVFSFWLVTCLDVFAIACAAGAALWVTYALGARTWRATGLAGVGAALLVVWALGGTHSLDAHTQARRWHGFGTGLTIGRDPATGQPLIADTRYQHIVIAGTADQTSAYTNGLLHTTWPDPYGAREEAATIMAQHPRTRRVLLVGSGYADLAAQVLQYPVERLDLVELDGTMLAMLASQLDDTTRQRLDDPRFRAYTCDGRFFVHQAHADPDRLAPLVWQGDRRAPGTPYDLVYVRLGDPDTALVNRFYTVEFYHRLRRVLAPGGVVAIHVRGVENYLTGAPMDYTATMVRTLQSVFAHVVVAPGTTSYVFASAADGVVTTDAGVLAERYRATGVEPKAFALIYESVFPPDKTAEVNRALADYPRGRLNHDTHPTAYWLNLRLVDLVSGRRLDALFAAGSTLARPWAGLALVGVLVLVVVVLAVWPVGARAERGLRRACLWSIATTGLTGMALEIVLLYAYQNLYGYVYRMIGLVVGTFMLGLALGGVWATRRAARVGPDAWHGLCRRLQVLVLLLGVFAAATPWVVHLIDRWGGGQVWLVLMVAAAGLLTGAQFPLAAAVHVRLTGRTGRSAGAIDSADHLGACIGAVLTGALLVPVWGTRPTCLALGVLCLSSVVLLAIVMHRARGA